jgi:hypothetical protein
MANFLFWNTNRRTDISGLVAKACWEREIDVLILAEYEPDPIHLLEQLNHPGRQRTYLIPFEPPGKLRFVTRYPLDALRSVHDEGDVAVRLVRPPVGIELLVAAVHLPSKMFMSPDEQAYNAARVSRKIGELESRIGHSNTLLIGDLNMDPFEHGMVAADSFHAVMDRSIAKEISRTVHGEDRKFFYNPMWGRYGDETPGPSGTYYRRGNQISPFWHIFDQVLLRPALLQYYAPNAAEIVGEIGGHSLLKGGRINQSISDHLPIFLRLDVEYGA